MEFRTVIKPLSKQGMITHSDGIMMLGSCFTNNIGERLIKALFRVDINPFGITFNPLSMKDEMLRIISDEPFTESSLFQHNGMWNSFMHHSSFSHNSKQDTLDEINNRLHQAHDNLKNAKTLILTWGTAYVFEHVGTGTTVNNCHKLPAEEFIRYRLDANKLIDDYTSLIAQLRHYNPDLQIIITVSPIRHMADGLAGNTVSKGMLCLAASDLAAIFPDVVTYFPSYEVMLDDLRDYRFYAADMVHPSDVAQDYIYELFLNSFCDSSTIATAQECNKFAKRLRHKPMTDNTAQIEAFNKATTDAYEALKLKYPYLEASLQDVKQYIK